MNLANWAITGEQNPVSTLSIYFSTWQSSLVPLFGSRDFNLKHCGDSFINLSKNKVLLSSVTASDCVTYTAKGSPRQQWTDSWHELIYTVRLFTQARMTGGRRMTHLEIKLLLLTCKGQPSHSLLKLERQETGNSIKIKHLLIFHISLLFSCAKF